MDTPEAAPKPSPASDLAALAAPETDPNSLISQTKPQASCLPPEVPRGTLPPRPSLGVDPPGILPAPLNITKLPRTRNRYRGIKVKPQDAARFWHKVENARQRGHCWLWQGAAKPSGHGLAWLPSYRPHSPMHAHKVAWLLVRGEIPEGLCVLHKCHNGRCCNPEHMYLGNRAENMRDRFRKAERRYRVKKGTPL